MDFSGTSKIFVNGRILWTSKRTNWDELDERMTMAVTEIWSFGRQRASQTAMSPMPNFTLPYDIYTIPHRTMSSSIFFVVVVALLPLHASANLDAMRAGDNRKAYLWNLCMQNYGYHSRANDHFMCAVAFVFTSNKFSLLVGWWLGSGDISGSATKHHPSKHTKSNHIVVVYTLHKHHVPTHMRGHPHTHTG